MSTPDPVVPQGINWPGVIAQTVPLVVALAPVLAYLRQLLVELRAHRRLHEQERARRGARGAGHAPLPVDRRPPVLRCVGDVQAEVVLQGLRRVPCCGGRVVSQRAVRAVRGSVFR